MSGNQSVTVLDLQAMMRSEHPPLLLDVRRADDRKKDPAMIPGADWRDPTQVAAWAEGLLGRETVIYCVRGGSVSRSVSDALRKMGVPARFLEGGLEAWKSSGKPGERSDS